MVSRIKNSKIPNISVHFFVKNGAIDYISLHQQSAKKGLTFDISSDRSFPEVNDLIKQWMKAYNQGQNPPVELPLDWHLLPPYTAIVLKALQKVPFGSVISYQELAQQTGNPRGARAVGNSCARNPFPLIIPCHRVIASDGSLGGFSGGLTIKEALLEYESVE